MRGVCRDTLGQCTIKNDNTTNLTGSHDKFVSERERGRGREVGRERGREGGREGGDREGEEENAKRLRVRGLEKTHVESKNCK